MKRNINSTIKEEQNELENIYNLERSVRFTGLPDVDYKILQEMDIKTLNRFCTTSTYATKLCDSKDFWINKIKNHGLPLELIDQYFINYNDWLNTYGNLEDTVFVTKNILLVSKLTGDIYILLDMRVAGKILDVDVPNDVTNLTIIYKKEDNESYVVVSEDNEKYVNKYKGDFDKVLLRAVYYTLLGYNNSIMDSLGVDYYINPNNYHTYINNLLNEENGQLLYDHALIRVGMWKLIYYNENRK